MSWRKAALFVGACSGVASPAAAHAPPQATGIQWLSGEGGERALVRTNRGLIIEDLAGGTFRIVCNDAFQVSLSEVPAVVVAPDGRLLLGTYASGLMVSSPDLCGYEPVAGAFDGLYPIALSSDAEGVMYAAALPYDGSSAGLLQSPDQGRTGTSLSELPGAPTALQVAPSDSSRLYVSITTAEGNLSFGGVLTSADAGLSFEEHPIELDPSELRVFLLAVAPEDPQLLFVRTQSRDGVTPERLLRSEDGGETFETVLVAHGPLSAVVESDTAVWAGGADGLYRSGDAGRSFERVETTDLTRIGCLASRAEALYACGYSAGEFGVQVFAHGSDGFEWFLRFPQVTARLDCPADSDEGESCGAAFADWAAEQGGEPTASSGGAGAPARDGAGAAPTEPKIPRPRASEAGCQVAPRAPVPPSFALIGVPLAVALRRLRRRCEPRRLNDGK